MTNAAHALWVEKYRPSSTDQYIFHNPTHRDKIQEFIKTKTIPHLLFAGVQGSGKTTIARILIDAVGVDELDVLTINASDERGIDTFRDAVKSFASAMPMGEFKVIHLEEADRLTAHAQDALKSFMEDASEYVRFILTCNRIHMISGPLRSRCQEFILAPSSKDDVVEYAATVLMSEHVKFQLPVLDQFVDASYPDVRKIINALQQYTVGGVLQSYQTSSSTKEYKQQILDCIDAGNWVDARMLACSSVSADQWEDFYRFMYDMLSSTKKFKNRDAWEEGIITIAEHLYKHAMCSDPEINAASMLIKLSKI